MPARAPNIVVCGAGIAGIAAAHALAVEHDVADVVLLEAGDPLAMTSDKSTESYRNWWPGPDAAMTSYMNRSIDLLEAHARTTGNRINMNRRGYVFASADPGKVPWLISLAQQAERHGAGPVRIHDTPAGSYAAVPDAGFDAALAGADIITDRALLRRHFPYLAPETCVLAHARRAGWLSAQQLGMSMLEAGRERGVRLVRARLVGLDAPNDRLEAVVVEIDGERRKLPATHLVLAAGAMLPALSKELGIELPIFAERHMKISFRDTTAAIPRSAPMLIWLDEQRLPWTEEERAVLVGDEATHWLTAPFPWGVHGRPDGGRGSTTVLALFNYESHPTEVVFPLPDAGPYAEITLRGMATMVPALKALLGQSGAPYVDGGYYVKTKENRPLIGPTRIGGVYVSGAYSGFGIMASAAGGELVAAHVLEKPLPAYARAFQLDRYQDPDYRELLANWGDGGQL